VTRLSGDQKQVLVQRNAEHERHSLQSAMTSESDVDDDTLAPPPPPAELVTDGSTSDDKNTMSTPEVITVDNSAEQKDLTSALAPPSELITVDNSAEQKDLTSALAPPSELITVDNSAEQKDLTSTEHSESDETDVEPVSTSNNTQQRLTTDSGQSSSS